MSHSCRRTSHAHCGDTCALAAETGDGERISAMDNVQKALLDHEQLVSVECWYRDGFTR